MTTDALDERLRHLTVASPDPGRVVSRVLGTPPRPRVPLQRLAASAAVALVLIALVGYFVPSASTVIAKVPLAEQALGANAHVTSVGSSSTSSGYTLVLTGAYADSTRTELLIRANPAIAFIGNDATMTDQFGRSYHAVSGTSNPLTGDSRWDFQPLAWPDALTGARITVTISSLQLGISSSDVVKGSWILNATLGVDEGHEIALPAPVVLGPARFQFTSVVYTPATIAIDVDMTGATSQDAAGSIPTGGAKPAPALSFDVLDTAGNIVTGSYEIDDGWFGVSHLHLLAYRDDSGGGGYTIRISYRGRSVDRTISVY